MVRCRRDGRRYSGAVTPDDPDGDVEALQHSVEELRKENESLRQGEELDGATRGARRWKRISSWILVVLACILAVLSVLVVFVRNQVLNTDTYVSTW
jgi:hypothetical protein